MALLEEWILSERVTAAMISRVLEVVDAIVPQRFEPEVRVSSKGERLMVVVSVPDDAVTELATSLDATIGYFDDWDWQEEIDELEDSNDYEIWVELTNKRPETISVAQELPVLSVGSNEGDNDAGWPLAFVLAARLAQELGAVEAEDHPSGASSV